MRGMTGIGILCLLLLLAAVVLILVGGLRLLGVAFGGVQASGAALLVGGVVLAVVYAVVC